jgi:Flp pilus assembly protein TadD
MLRQECDFLKLWIRGTIMQCINIVFLLILLSGIPGRAETAQPASYAGSSSCRECHDRFYQLWSTSMHGLAMQPFTAAFARARLTPQTNSLRIDTRSYQADINRGAVIEKGSDGEKAYPIVHVLGEKNVLYFLTLLEKGKLQTLPVAYDVQKKEWFDMAASGVRHMPGGVGAQEPISWKESPYTFNTSCYSCHVSQLSTNYNPASDSYSTTWAEPGINCETCHGPSSEHNRLARELQPGQKLPRLAIISTKAMTTQQRNDLCLSCHAKARPLTVGYVPNELFFDHFDLVTLEDPDYYPDGRDLGENYTATSWSMSPCAQSGKLDCMHCHTSSGRYRFKTEKVNDACLPCHQDKVDRVAEHARHPADSEAGKCISCHMPMTTFARMQRSDHSMQPPAPAATTTYNSPNACTICHQDKDAAWADTLVRQWRSRDYQAPILRRAGLIDAARKQDWTKLPEILVYLQSNERDDVVAASLVRLLSAANDQRIPPILQKLARDSSPLIRAASVETMSLHPSPEATTAMLKATTDPYRLVRIRAAAGLADLPPEQVPGKDKDSLARACQEYLAMLMARPDQWTSHYNLGNYHLGRQESEKAVSAYQAALEKEPQAVIAMVNLAIAHARLGEGDKAEKALRVALDIAPGDASANFNMGLIQAENNNRQQAEVHLRKAIDADPQLAPAAFNLCILTADSRLDEAVSWCRKAVELNPADSRYGFTLAYYLNKHGDREEAAAELNRMIQRYPDDKEARLLLEQIQSGIRTD